MSPEILTVYESASNSDDSEGEDGHLDLSLEKTAQVALSEWFGISLRRLIRPIRVIYALEDTKKKCASILSDEGYYAEDGSEDDQSEACQEGDSTPTSGAHSPNRSNLQSHGPCGSNINKRRLHNGGIEEDLDETPGAITTTRRRGKGKKRRSLGDLSCPYRKRNPHRFSVRTHESCANRSFENMALLK